MPAEPGPESWPGCPGTTAAVTRTPRSPPVPGSGHSSTAEPIGSIVTAPSEAFGFSTWINPEIPMTRAAAATTAAGAKNRERRKVESIFATSIPPLDRLCVVIHMRDIWRNIKIRVDFDSCAGRQCNHNK